MAERGTNTLDELFQRFMKDLGQFKLYASPEDAAVVAQLEQFIIETARDPIRKGQEAGLLPTDGQLDPAMLAMANAGPAGGGGGPSFLGTGGMRGVPSGPAPVATNSDELRRMLAPQ